VKRSTITVNKPTEIRRRWFRFSILDSREKSEVCFQKLIFLLAKNCQEVIRTEISNRKFAVALLLTLLVSVTVTYAVQSALMYFHKDPRVIANVYFYEENNGQSVLIAQTGNLITDLGENRTLDALIGTATTLTGIAVGNESAIDQTDKGLTTEATTSGFGRVAANVSAAWMNGGDYSKNFTASFDASALIAVNSAILCWSTTPSAQDAYAISFLTDGTAHQFPSASRLTVIWAITVNGN
jgi:hypothetical protein